MTDLGLLRQFLGLEIKKYGAGIKVSQPKYFAGMLLKFKIFECKVAKCPFLSRIKLGEFVTYPLVENSLYSQLVGSLLYLTHSQPIVGVVSRYMQHPHEIH